MSTLEEKNRALSQKVKMLKEQLAELQRRFDESNEALEAIRSGSVDALVINGEKGETIYTLQGAEYSYRVLVESINEGAVTMVEDGTILYCNQHFAQMLKSPLQTVIGSTIYQYIPDNCKTDFKDLFMQGLHQNCRGETTLNCQDSTRLPVMVSFNVFQPDKVNEICMVVADLTEQKKVEKQALEETILAETMAFISRSLVESGPDDKAILDIIVRSGISPPGALRKFSLN